MATVRKLKTGKWQSLVRRKGYPDQSRSFQTRSDADQWGRLIESEIERGLFLDRSAAETTLLGTLMDRYIEEVTPRKRSAVVDRQRMLYLKRHFGQFSLSALRSQHIADWRDRRLKEGRAGSTVVKEINALSHLIDTAIKDWGFGLASNPAKLVRKPKEARGRERRLEPGEEEFLLSAIGQGNTHLMPSIIALAIETGMRLGELLSLRWQDINLQARTTILHETKNGEIRVVPLSTRALRVLESIPRHITDKRVFWCWARSDSFSKAWVRHLARARKAYADRCRKVGEEARAGFLDDLRFHDLRHEAVSRFFEKGLNLMEVSSISGHKTLAMLKRYTHLKPESLLARLG